MFCGGIERNLGYPMFLKVLQPHPVFYNVLPEEIIMAVSHGDSVEVFTTRAIDSFSFLGPMGVFMSKCSEVILRVHNEYAVNIRHIDRIDLISRMIYMRDSKFRARIGYGEYKKKVKQLINQ